MGQRDEWSRRARGRVERVLRRIRERRERERSRAHDARARDEAIAQALTGDPNGTETRSMARRLPRGVEVRETRDPVECGFHAAQPSTAKWARSERSDRSDREDCL